VKNRTRLSLLLIAATLVSFAGLASANAFTTGKLLCGKYDHTLTSNGRYAINNDRWGDDTLQCIRSTATGFTSVEMHHNKTSGRPGAYPSLQFGCNYGHCTPGSGLPMSVSSPAFKRTNTGVAVSAPQAGIWNSSYDIWFDPTTKTTGNVTGIEVMLWFGHRSTVRPLGQKVGAVYMMGSYWDLWYTPVTATRPWRVASYVRRGNTQQIAFPINVVYSDLVRRGYAKPTWYMRSVQAGFEIWQGQLGLSVKNFWVKTA
jgi:hypothetical protein